jgi:DNA-binding MarR family transcriptional regulator
VEKSIEKTLIFYILELANQLKKNGDIISQMAGLTTQQWLILLHLAKDPNIPYFDLKPQKKPLLASELAEALNVSRPNITNLIQSLLHKELITQVEDDDDRRRKRLKLTEKGWNALEIIEPFRGISNRGLFASFTEEEKRQFLEFVKTCVSKMHKVLITADHR